MLESQYSVLVSKMKSGRDFEENRLAMDTFLSTVLAQSFLLVRPVSMILPYCNLCKNYRIVGCSLSGRNIQDVFTIFLSDFLWGSSN